MNPPMTYSGNGLAITESFEGCRLVPYQDSKGVWTDGFGNTHGVVPGQEITREKAIQDLNENIQNSVNDVNRLVTVQLTQGEFDALVDFDFNLGRGNLAQSTLLVDLNKGDFNAAADQFERWDKCNGLVLSGLLRRRLAEKSEFTGSSNEQQT